MRTSTTADGDHGVLLEVCAVTSEKVRDDGDAFRGRAVGKPHQATMWPFSEHQQAEVLIDRDEDAIFGERLLQDRGVAGVRGPRTGVDDIVPGICEPAGELLASATVDQERTTQPTRMLSNESLAMTAWA
ncbi:MAG: hypothetical protein ABIP94_02125 [Planctomycetota bacterium]